MPSSGSDRLTILWTSADREVAENMVFMYGANARLEGWWDEVTLLIWGPSARLAARDQKIQEHLARMKEVGVELVACKRCADNYGVSDALEAQGIEVFYAGKYLTNKIKAGEKLVTF